MLMGRLNLHIMVQVKNDVGRTFILGTPTSQQKNTYQITKIETFNVK